MPHPLQGVINQYFTQIRATTIKKVEGCQSNKHKPCLIKGIVTFTFDLLTPKTGISVRITGL